MSDQVSQAERSNSFEEQRNQQTQDLLRDVYKGLSSDPKKIVAILDGRSIIGSEKKVDGAISLFEVLAMEDDVVRAMKSREPNMKVLQAELRGLQALEKLLPQLSIDGAPATAESIRNLDVRTRPKK